MLPKMLPSVSLAYAKDNDAGNRRLGTLLVLPWLGMALMVSSIDVTAMVQAKGVDGLVLDRWRPVAPQHVAVDAGLAVRSGLGKPDSRRTAGAGRQVVCRPVRMGSHQMERSACSGRRLRLGVSHSIGKARLQWLQAFRLDPIQLAKRGQPCWDCLCFRSELAWRFGGGRAAGRGAAAFNELFLCEKYPFRRASGLFGFMRRSTHSRRDRCAQGPSPAKYSLPDHPSPPAESLRIEAKRRL
jgi:hypothetical protein